MKAFYPRVLRPMIVVLCSVLLLSLIWLSYITYLTQRGDRACGYLTEMVDGRDMQLNFLAFQQLLDTYSSENGDIGLQATVIFSDGTTWSGVSGYADIKDECPMILDHHLFIGSMTKLYTSVLVMKEVQRGQISLQDTIDRWLHLPYAEDVTVEMLLNHTSGIPNYTDRPWFLVRYLAFPARGWQADELVAVIGNAGLQFEPGSRYKYSNSNYLLLGVIFEKVTKTPYPILLRTFVVDQLGMGETYYSTYPPEILIANGYDESILHLGRTNMTGFRRSLETGAYSSGGILSTSRDVATFVHLLFTGGIVNNSTLMLMETFVDTPKKDLPLQQGYGLGVRYLIVDGEAFVGHTGSIPGYSGIAMHNQESKYTIVILSNLSTIWQTELLSQFQAVITDLPHPRQKSPWFFFETGLQKINLFRRRPF